MVRRMMHTRYTVILTSKRWRDIGMEILYRTVLGQQWKSLALLMDNTFVKYPERVKWVSQLYLFNTLEGKNHDIVRITQAYVGLCTNMRAFASESMYADATSIFNALIQVEELSSLSLVSNFKYNLMVGSSSSAALQKLMHLAVDFRGLHPSTFDNRKPFTLPMVEAVALVGPDLQFLRYFSHWTLLCLKHLNVVDPEVTLAVQAVQDAIDNALVRSRQLKTLQMKFRERADMDLPRILNHCPNLTTLTLSDFDWRTTFHVASPWLASPHQMIRNVRLIPEEQSEHYMASLPGFLHRSFPRLSTIRIMGEPITAHGAVRVQGARAAWNAFHVLCQVQGIHLEDCTGKEMEMRPV